MHPKILYNCYGSNTIETDYGSPINPSKEPRHYPLTEPCSNYKDGIWGMSLGFGGPEPQKQLRQCCFGGAMNMFVNEKAWVIDFLKVEGATVAIESFQGADAM